MMQIIEPLKILNSQVIDDRSFQKHGQVVWPKEDGTPYGESDAQLVLNKGIPRFYLMRLYNRGRVFHRITRHLSCTQCLGAMGDRSWLLAVAPSKDVNNENEKPDLSEIQAFQIPGNCFVKLHLGTWHAGPFFDPDFMDFYNLELADTNLVDHHTCDLKKAYNLSFLLE